MEKTALEDLNRLKTEFLGNVSHELKTVETHFPILNKGGNRLEINAGLDLPMVNADPERVTQILVNLIANALKQTMKGIITVSAKEADGRVIA